MEIFVLLFLNHDGDRYKIHTDYVKSLEEYTKATEKRASLDYGEHSIYLVKASTEVEFGTGARGDLFGCEIIYEETFDID